MMTLKNKHKQKYNNKNKGLILDLSLHFTSALVGSILIYIFLSPKLILWWVLGTIFIDLDHLFDHFLRLKQRAFKFPYTIKAFFKGEFLKFGKVVLPFHSWEIVFIIYIVGFLLNSLELLFLAGGLTIHLIIDNCKRKNKLFYLISYRVRNKWNVKKLLPEYKNNSK